MALKLECILTLGDTDALNAWRLLRATRPDILPNDRRCKLYARDLKVSGVERALDAGNEKHFDVTLDEAEFRFSLVASYRHTLLQIKGCIENTADASRWMDALVSLSGFLHGRLYDKDYDSWQNTNDPGWYQRKKRPYQHLPMRNNGLPPPLNRMEIDTSHNPGRRVLRRGFVEAVGAPMWLSAKFLAQMGITESELQTERCWVRNRSLPACGSCGSKTRRSTAQKASRETSKTDSALSSSGPLNPTGRRACTDHPILSRPTPAPRRGRSRGSVRRRRG